MKGRKRAKVKIRARKNPEGFMYSATKIERPKRGKGSFNRRKKHRKNYDSN